MKVYIGGMDKVVVLGALYDAVDPDTLVSDLTRTEILEIFEGRTNATLRTNPYHIISIKGHVLGVDLSGEDFDPGEYDRLYGEGKAKQVIRELRSNLKKIASDPPWPELHFSGDDQSGVYIE